MTRAFKDFELGKLDDGRLYWIGTVTPGIYETKFGESRSYTLMAVYQQNHPHAQMGSSVYVYPLLPDAEELMEELYKKTGSYPSHILRDANNQRYLCTAESKDVKTGSTVSTRPMGRLLERLPASHGEQRSAVVSLVKMLTLPSPP